jgi:anti-sigma B factor antagonist
MEIATTEIGSSAARVTLAGRLDAAGAESVALPLATVAGAKQGLIVDMSKVSFIASTGIRHLVAAAKAQLRCGGRLVLLRPTSAVAEVLTASELTILLPIVHSEQEAVSAIHTLRAG